MRERPLAIVVGSIGKLPYAGMTYYWLHHIRGFQELGFTVHYVEQQNKPDDYYDVVADRMTDDLRPALAYLASLQTVFGAAPDAFTLVDRHGNVHGSSATAYRDALERSAALVAVADLTWNGDFERSCNRVFIDGDPMFTQAALLAGDRRRTEAIDRYGTLFTYGARIGAPDCAIPDCGRKWHPLRPVVATSLWKPTPTDQRAPLTALLHWSAGSHIEVGGRVYGHKDVSFDQLRAFPHRVDRPVHLALGGGGSMRPALREEGWVLVDPIDATRDAAAYGGFIDDSYADVGIAKHAYVASRSGWFSDRATCFLAAGRPVLHQDTGYQDWLGDKPGVLRFTNLDQLVAGVAELEADYERHAAGARGLAELEFEATGVLASLLQVAGVALPNPTGEIT